MRTLLTVVGLLAVGLYAPELWACGCGRAKAAQAEPAGGCGGGCGQEAEAGCGGGGGGCGCGRLAQAPAQDRNAHAITSRVAWRTLDKGLVEAKQKNLPMLVHLSFGKQCPHCAELEKQIFSHNTVLATLNGTQRAVPVKIPLWAMTAKERAFAERVGYGEDCLLALTDSQGRIMGSKSGQPLSTKGVPSPEALLESLAPLTN